MLDTVAVHESGHALAACLLDVAFHHVAAAPDGNGGHIRFDAQTAASDPADWLLVSLAGIGAERAVFGTAGGDPEHDSDLDSAIVAMESADVPLEALPGIVGALADVFTTPTLTKLLDTVADDLERHNGWLPAAAVRGRVWALPAGEIASVRRRLRRIISGRVVSNL